MQVLFLIAIFTTGASAVLHVQPPPPIRLALLVTLLALMASVFLVSICSGGVRSWSAHVTLAPDADAAARPPPDSVLSHPLDVQEILGMVLHPEARPPRIGDVPSGSGSLIRVYEVDSVNSGEVFEDDEFDEDGCAVRRPLLVASTPLMHAAHACRCSLPVRQLLCYSCAQGPSRLPTVRRPLACMLQHAPRTPPARITQPCPPVDLNRCPAAKAMKC